MERPDPTNTGPDKYKVIFENERVRVLEYRDKPGDRTKPHYHPASLMYTLSSFKRRLGAADREVVVDKQAGEVNWLETQQHYGENVGAPDTHVIFVELKEAAAGSVKDALGPSPPA